MSDRTSNSPDHLYDPQGLTVADLIERLKLMPPESKVWIETSDDDPEGEGTLIGEVVEVQDGRDRAVYLRIDASQAAVRDTLGEV